MWYREIMGKSIRDISKKETRGRKKTTGPGEPVMLRLHPPLLTDLDVWIVGQDDSPSRPEAIRRLIEQALSSAKPSGPRGQKTSAKASDMAGKEIDRLGDKSATDDERASRKRRLLRGPKEFRDIRGDLPKPKAT